MGYGAVAAPAGPGVPAMEYAQSAHHAAMLAVSSASIEQSLPTLTGAQEQSPAHMPEDSPVDGNSLAKLVLDVINLDDDELVWILSAVLASREHLLEPLSA